MTRLVTVKPNPSRQSRERKIKEISFHINGEYYGALIKVDTAAGIPRIEIYCVDEGIQVHVDSERTTRF